MNRFKRVAIVHDDFIQKGGAEKIAETFLEIFPGADIFASIISEDWHNKFKEKHPESSIKYSFLNKFPRKEKLYKYFAFFYPVAFYLFDFSDYDLVISSSSRFAHGIRTGKDTLHVSYIHSPARMVWEPQNYFNKPFVILGFPIITLFRLWDKHASRLPDILIANSNTSFQRVKNYWNRDAEIINPYHSLSTDRQISSSQKDHYLIVSRLEKWKKIDIAIAACCELQRSLVIVGEGKDKARLMQLADPIYVKFTGRLSDEDLINTYLHSKALSPNISLCVGISDNTTGTPKA